MPREKKTDHSPASRQCHQIRAQKMRKNRELKTDLTRVPTLTWLMFLKFVDDMERVLEDEAVLAGEPYRNLIDPPYRWRRLGCRPRRNYRTRSARLHQWRAGGSE